MKGRIIAIGDVHGCAAALRAILDRVAPRPQDTIVTLGDYVDRGPDSRGVLDLLIELGGRCQLVPILGNHDEVMRDALRGAEPLDHFLRMGGDATLDSYGPGRTLDLVPPAHRDFLEGCRDHHETARHLFLHASYDPEWSLADQPDGTIRWSKVSKSRHPGRHRSGKTAIVGHSSQKGGEILDLGHIKCIDTFCWGGGWLTALNVRTEEAWQVDREGRPRR